MGKINQKALSFLLLPSQVKSLVDDDMLVCLSEECVYNAVARWAQAQVQAPTHSQDQDQDQDQDTDQDTDSESENNHQSEAAVSIDSVLTAVRFPLLPVGFL